MKKISLLALTLVLTAALFAGCGCTNQRMDNTSAPTVLPTNEENWATDASKATTESTTASRATDATQDSGMIGGGSATTDNGNGPLEDNTTGAAGGIGGNDANGGMGEETTAATTR